MYIVYVLYYAVYFTSLHFRYIPPHTDTTTATAAGASKKKKAKVTITSEEYQDIRHMLKLKLRAAEEGQDVTYPGMLWRDLRNWYLSEVSTVYMHVINSSSSSSSSGSSSSSRYACYKLQLLVAWHCYTCIY